MQQKRLKFNRLLLLFIYFLAVILQANLVGELYVDSKLREPYYVASQYDQLRNKLNPDEPVGIFLPPKYFSDADERHLNGFFFMNELSPVLLDRRNWISRNKVLVYSPSIEDFKSFHMNHPEYSFVEHWRNLALFERAR